MLVVVNDKMKELPKNSYEWLGWFLLIILVLALVYGIWLWQWTSYNTHNIQKETYSIINDSTGTYCTYKQLQQIFNLTQGDISKMTYGEQVIYARENNIYALLINQYGYNGYTVQCNINSSIAFIPLRLTQ